MIKTAKALTLLTLTALLFVAGATTAADAGPCTGCERQRRLCLFENKFIFDGEKATCHAAKLACFAQCDIDFETNADLRICKRACKENAVNWRADFIDALFEGREICNAADDVCLDFCENSGAGRRCLRDCSRVMMRCAQFAKKAKGTCFHQCRLSPEPVRDCKRGCRAVAVVEQAACSDGFDVCMPTCVGQE